MLVKPQVCGDMPVEVVEVIRGVWRVEVSVPDETLVSGAVLCGGSCPAMPLPATTDEPGALRSA